jgi:zinc/manganese transport system substrate-binding protein
MRDIPAAYLSFETPQVADFIAPIRAFGLGIVILLFAFSSVAGAAPLSVVAAESVYGDIAQQMGGDRVSVISILSNPAQDPHLFEAGASTARSVARARFVIYNGAGYDPWMAKLLSVPGQGPRDAIVAETFLKQPTDGNPHLWYDPDLIMAVADAMTAAFAAADPGGTDYDGRNTAFDASMQALTLRVAALRAKYKGTPVTATEPVFDYMGRQIGLDMRNAAFQRAVMNDTEPSASEVAAFEDDLRGQKVRVLLYNVQTTGAMPQRMRRIADEAGIPVVGISETEPAGMHYQDWMMAQLDALDKALSK